MVARRRRTRGFSLIELAITLLLIGVLALMAGPFTINWLILSDLQRAKGQLIQAHGVAKAVALRNAAGLLADEAVVAVRVDAESNHLTLVSCPGGSFCSEEQLWTAELPRGVSLSFGADGVSDIQLNSSGKLLVTDHWISYQISKGGQVEDGVLH